MRNCYTYLIGWSKFNKFYYGRRTRLGCDPSEFWKSYFTSSIHVFNYRIQNGDPDIIQICKIFGENHERCEKWETEVLMRLNLAGDVRFLNKRNNEGFGRCGTGEASAYSENGEYIGVISSADSRWGISVFGINKFNKDLPEKIRRENLLKIELGTHNFLGDNNPSSKKVKLGTHHWLAKNNSVQRKEIDDLQRKLVQDGKHHWLSESHREKTGERTKTAIINGDHPFGNTTICPRCGKEGQNASMKRWHFDNCKKVNL